MPIVIDYNAQLLKITSPDTDIDLQTLHDFVEDERGLAQPEGLSRIASPAVSATGDPIFEVNGKIEDPANPGLYSQINLFLIPPWQIQFWGGSGYTTISGGKLSGGLNDEPIKATGTAGDITVLQSQVDGTYTQIETGTSGLTPTEAAMLLEFWQAFGLDATNPVSHDKTPAQITFAGVTLTLTEDVDGNVVVQRS